jgi:hypothetical protein
MNYYFKKIMKEEIIRKIKYFLQVVLEKLKEEEHF